LGKKFSPTSKRAGAEIFGFVENARIAPCLPKTPHKNSYLEKSILRRNNPFKNLGDVSLHHQKFNRLHLKKLQTFCNRVLGIFPSKQIFESDEALENSEM